MEKIKNGFFEYKMSKQCANELLTKRNKMEQRMEPQHYLCKVVNETYGIKGTCERVIIDA